VDILFYKQTRLSAFSARTIPKPPSWMWLLAACAMDGQVLRRLAMAQRR
jgi:hypothetical protein